MTATAALPASPVTTRAMPTAEQIAAYRRDGFLVVQEYMPRDELVQVREHFARAFGHDWETGLAPDEVNYTPGVTPPDRTRQLCNVWKADRTLARTTLSRRNGAFAAALAGAPGMRLLQDNAIWKPPSGKALLAHQDAAYTGWLTPKNMTTCWIALDDTAADRGTIYYVRGSHRWPHAPAGGQFHAPDDWLGYLREVVPDGDGDRGRADRGARRRRRLPRRLDVARLAAERARRRRAPLDHLAPGHERHASGARRRDAPALQPLPAAGRARARRGVLPGRVARDGEPTALIDEVYTA